ncbi:MAG: MMPL family transporter [Nitrospiraceae bacterium]|nr:MMPL family transporter [Nitrospiraceae bacterium]
MAKLSRKKRRALGLNSKKSNESKHKVEVNHKGNVSDDKKSASRIRTPNKFLSFYYNHYKSLMWITVIMLILALIQVGVQYYQTGSYLHKGISLKGGIEITVLKPTNVSLNQLKSSIKSALPKTDVEINEISGLGSKANYVIEVSTPKNVNTSEAVNKTINAVSESFGGLTSQDYSTRISGPQFSESFFRQLTITVLLAFLLMAIIVFIYFRILVPSFAVVLSAFSDIIVTLAIVNLMGVKVSSAGIAAFLMLIGYSVDTDILLTTRVLKRRNTGNLLRRIVGAMKTGLTMSLTTFTAVVAGLIITNSETIHQIMLIVTIGLLVDVLNTWIQNVGILRFYIKKKYHEE